MKLHSLLPAGLASALLLAAGSVFAQTPKNEKDACACCAAPAATSTTATTGKLVPASDVDAAWLEQARKAYPLESCPVSGDKLGTMGKPRDYVYRVDGQPDRLVRFCCGGCLEDFEKEPAKFLATIDAAKAGKPAADSGHAM
jgi:hypothetical protein